MLNRIGTPHLLVTATYLACTGLVMVYSASALRAEITFGSSMVYFWRQLMGLALGVGVAALVMHLPLAWIRRSSYLVWAVAIGALVATLSALGVEQNNARRWLDLGGFVFQPLEIAKLATVIAIARWLSDHQSEMRDYRVAMGMPLLLAAWLRWAYPMRSGRSLVRRLASGAPLCRRLAEILARPRPAPAMRPDVRAKASGYRRVDRPCKGNYLQPRFGGPAFQHPRRVPPDPAVGWLA